MYKEVHSPQRHCQSFHYCVYVLAMPVKRIYIPHLLTEGKQTNKNYKSEQGEREVKKKDENSLTCQNANTSFSHESLLHISEVNVIAR